MNAMQDKSNARIAMRLAGACGLIALLPFDTLPATNDPPAVCDRAAQQLQLACENEARGDFRIGFAVCLNLGESDEAKECLQENRQARAETMEECRDGREIRAEICDKVGPGPYDPDIEPADFVPLIDNPHAPFKPGAWWEYRKTTDEGTERSRVEVLNRHREILGVNTVVVRDRVWLNGELQEDTEDWLAQDVRGNVWYFGELSKSFEDGTLVSLEGSFEAGRDGAKPGLWIKAAPKVGDFYRQEWSPGDAEDVVEIASVNAPDDVPFRNSRPVLMTRDFSPQSPGDEELKFYVPGVGVVLEIEIGTGERLELVDHSH